MNKKIIERRVGNPTWIRDPVEAELIRQIHNQWCRDNGYAIRGRYRQKCVLNKAKMRQDLDTGGIAEAFEGLSKCRNLDREKSIFMKKCDRSVH